MSGSDAPGALATPAILARGGLRVADVLNVCFKSSCSLILPRRSGQLTSAPFAALSSLRHGKVSQLRCCIRCFGNGVEL
jgi:hypothetical protein